MLCKHNKCPDVLSELKDETAVFPKYLNCGLIAGIEEENVTAVKLLYKTRILKQETHAFATAIVHRTPTACAQCACDLTTNEPEMRYLA